MSKDATTTANLAKIEVNTSRLSDQVETIGNMIKGKRSISTHRESTITDARVMRENRTRDASGRFSTVSSGKVAAEAIIEKTRQMDQAANIADKSKIGIMEGFSSIVKNGTLAAGNKALSVGGNDTVKEATGTAAAGPVWGAVKEMHCIAKDLHDKTKTSLAESQGKKAFDRMAVGRITTRKALKATGVTSPLVGSSQSGDSLVSAGLLVAVAAAAIGIQQFVEAIQTGESTINNIFKKITGLDAGKETQGDIDKQRKQGIANIEIENAKRVEAGKAPHEIDRENGTVKHIKRFETGPGKTDAESAGTISTGKGDHGGKSYGIPQLASGQGEVEKFLGQSGYAEQFKGLKVGSKEFDNLWKKTAASDPKFSAAQIKYTNDTKTKPQMAELQRNGIDLSGKGDAVKAMVASTANQYGDIPIIKNALNGKNADTMSDSEILSAVQDYKAAHVAENFKSSSPKVQAGVTKRIQDEKKSLLAMDAEAKPKTPLKDPAAQMPPPTPAEGPTKQAAATIGPGINGPTSLENVRADSKKIGMQFDNALLTLQAYDRI